jgi:predicted RNA-binding Zn-ribbon protein involved in translation (DUF1610 family)
MSFMSNVLIKNTEKRGKKFEDHCPFCGSVLQDIPKKAMFYCPNCGDLTYEFLMCKWLK